MALHKRCQGQISGYKSLAFSPTLLSEVAEKALHQAIQERQIPYSQAIKAQEYAKALHLLSELQPTLAELFEKVKILDDTQQIRNNRLALLQEVAGLFNQVADFQKIQQQ